MLLPYQSRVFESALTPAQAVERLQGAVAPRQALRVRRAEQPFEGTVENTSFQIQRVVGYRNSFLPQLHGRIESMRDGHARIVVAFRLHPAVAVFMSLWFGFLILFGANALGQSPSGPAELDPRLLLGGMLVFGVVLLFGAFVPEAHKAARLLKDIFRARQSPVGSAA